MANGAHSGFLQATLEPPTSDSRGLQKSTAAKLPRGAGADKRRKRPLRRRKDGATCRRPPLYTRTSATLPPLDLAKCKSPPPPSRACARPAELASRRLSTWPKVRTLWSCWAGALGILKSWQKQCAHLASDAGKDQAVRRLLDHERPAVEKEGEVQAFEALLGLSPYLWAWGSDACSLPLPALFNLPIPASPEAG